MGRAPRSPFSDRLKGVKSVRLCWELRAIYCARCFQQEITTKDPFTLVPELKLYARTQGRQQRPVPHSPDNYLRFIVTFRRGTWRAGKRYFLRDLEELRNEIANVLGPRPENLHADTRKKRVVSLLSARHDQWQKDIRKPWNSKDPWQKTPAWFDGARGNASLKYKADRSFSRRQYPVAGDNELKKTEERSEEENDHSDG